MRLDHWKRRSSRHKGAHTRYKEASGQQEDQERLTVNERTTVVSCSEWNDQLVIKLERY